MVWERREIKIVFFDRDEKSVFRGWRRRRRQLLAASSIYIERARRRWCWKLRFSIFFSHLLLSFHPFPFHKRIIQARKEAKMAEKLFSREQRKKEKNNTIYIITISLFLSMFGLSRMTRHEKQLNLNRIWMFENARCFIQFSHWLLYACNSNNPRMLCMHPISI